MITLEVPQNLVLTFYLNRRGKVLSVGLTSSEPIAQDFAQHFTYNLKQLQFPKPKRRYTKITYPW